MPPLSYTPIIVAGWFAVLFAVEKFFPLRESKAGLLARLLVNVSLTALAFLVAALVVRPSALHTLAWATAQPLAFRMRCHRTVSSFVGEWPSFMRE